MRRKITESLAVKLAVSFTAIVVFACLLLVGTTTAIFKEVNTMIEEIRYNDVLDRNVKAEVQTALSIVQHYYDEEKNGTYTEEQAQSYAKEAVRAIRYNDDQGGYIWIDATDGTLVMHPILADQEGTNRMELEDCNGVKILQKIMEVADEGGYNQFVFTKSDGVTEAPKVAYSKKFDGWNWVLTSGCYMDDVKASMDNTSVNRIFSGSKSVMIAESLVLIIVMICVTILIVRRLMKSLGVINEGLKRLAVGNLEDMDRSPMEKSRDEIGMMIRNMNVAVKNLRELVQKSVDTTNDVCSSSEQMKKISNSAMTASDQISHAIEAVANESGEQVSAIANVMDSVNTMDEGSTEIQKAVSKIDTCTRKLTDSSAQMRENLGEMKNGSSDMTAQVHNISARISETNQTIEHMSDILDSIENIADQTKLLSLNASIEAARAGESGKGFAVVAESIKSLSENTANELTNIKQIIGNLVDGFKECNTCIESVVKSNEVSISDTEEVIQAFESLNLEIESMGSHVKTIRSVVGETVSEISRISGQMTSIEEGAQKAAAASEEVTASVQELDTLMQTAGSHSSELSQKAEGLVEKMQQFTI